MGKSKYSNTDSELIKLKEANDKLKEKNSDLEFKILNIPEVEKQSRKLHQENEHLQDKNREILKSNSQLVTVNEELHEEISRLQNEIAKITEINTQKEYIQNQNEILLAKNIEVEETIKQSESEIIRQQKQIDESKTEIDSLRVITNENSNRIKTFEQRIQDNDRAQQKAAKRSFNEITKLKAEKANLEQRVQEFTLKLEQNLLDLEQSNRISGGLESSLSALRNEKNKLIEERNQTIHETTWETIKKLGELYTFVCSHQDNLNYEEISMRFEEAFTDLGFKLQMFPKNKEKEIELDPQKMSLEKMLQQYDWSPHAPFEGLKNQDAKRFHILRNGLIANGKILLKAILMPLVEDSQGDING